MPLRMLALDIDGTLLGPDGHIAEATRRAVARAAAAGLRPVLCTGRRFRRAAPVARELGLDAPVRFLFKFRYHARYDTAGAEHELCHVYAGPLTGPPAVNANEIAATTMMPADALDRELAARPQLYTPWLQLEWLRIRAETWPAVEEIARTPRC